MTTTPTLSTLGRVSGVACPPRQRTRPAGLRLTRRGRLVLFGIPILAVLVAVLVGAGFAMTAADASTGHEPSVSTVTVQPGESLWDVAQRTNPSRDPREVISEIAELNGLDGAELARGQQLDVPSAR